MTVRLRSVVVGASALAIAGASVLASAGAASASVPSPWEPDPNSLGSIVFYDASGNVITGGNNLSQIASYFAATSGPSAPTANKATLYFAAPNHALATGAWFNGIVSASTTFPNAAAPAPLNTLTKPLVTAAAGDADLTAFLATATLDPTANYANIIQVRLKDSGPGGVGSGTKYWETNISYNSANGTWAVNDPVSTPTTASISATPPSPQTLPGATQITLSSTVATNPTGGTFTGTVQFMNGGSAVGSPQAVSNGSPTAQTIVPAPTSPVDFTFTAVFTPTPGTLVLGSTSSVLNYHVGAPIPTTQTALSVNPGSVPAFSPVTFTANVTTPAGGGGSPTSAGQVQFFSGASLVATATTDDGTVGEFKSTVSSFAQGSYSITAKFVPTNPTALQGSTSPVVPLTVTASTCPGTPTTNPITGEPGCVDTQNIKVSVSAGTLTITTPYTATNPFVLPDMQLNAAGTLLSSGPVQFPKAGDNPITVTSSIAGSPNWTVSVTASNLTGLNNAANIINGENLGLTGGALVAHTNPAQTVNFTAIPAGLGIAPGTITGAGLLGGPHTFAQSAGGGNGSTQMTGQLTLNAPTTTVADTYTGTITFSVA
jgi:hypothetical protein